MGVLKRLLAVCLALLCLSSCLRIRKIGPEQGSDAGNVPEEYAGIWRSETGVSTLTVDRSGVFFYVVNGESYSGKLVWTDKENGLWASGPRYELVLDSGDVLYGDAYVTAEIGFLAFAVNGGAERFFRGSVVIARRAEDFLASWPEYIEYAADTGEYAAGVLLIPMTDVEDFTLMSLVYEGGSVGDEPVFTAVDLAQFPEIGPEKPLLLSMTFGEIFPAYGFSYVDGTGARRTFGITESGRDGSLEVTEIRIARG